MKWEKVVGGVRTRVSFAFVFYLLLNQQAIPVQ
jgi:hypothetical protein